MDVAEYRITVDKKMQEKIKRRLLKEYHYRWFDGYCEEKSIAGEEKHSLWRYFKMNPERFILNVEGGFDYV